MKQLAPSFSAALRSRGESEDVKTTTGTWAYAGRLPKALQHITTVTLRQIQVQHDEIRD